MVDLHRTGQQGPSDLAELFGVARSPAPRARARATTDTAATGSAATSPAK